MDSSENTPEIVKQFVNAIDNRPDFQGEFGFFSASLSPFVIECMTWDRGRTLPSFPTPSKVLHHSAHTLVFRENEDTVGAFDAVSQERLLYYYGITNDGDQPELLYRSSSEKDPWVAPTGRFAHPPTKFARPVHGLLLNKVWDTVGPLIDDLVYATIKTRYSIDPIRFLTVPHGEDVKDGTLGPAVIWVTVHPDSCTSVDTAHRVSQTILQLLAENGVNDVQVEWCEGITSKAGGPPLLPIVRTRNATAYVRRHLTAALGMPIAPDDNEEQDAQGSIGFFFHENIDKQGNPSDKVFAVTNYHVLCKTANEKYDFTATGSPHQHVRVCGSHRFQRGLDEIKDAVAAHGIDVGICAEDIANLEANMDRNQDDALDLEGARQELERHRAAIVELKNFYEEVRINWGNIACRNIGCLEYSPPISIDVDDRSYTQDWATIRLDSARFLPNFRGNVIDLGTAISPHKLIGLMYPRNNSKTTFKYPSDRLLRIRGFVTKEQLAILDSNTQPSIAVMKDGCATDLTVGICTGLESFVSDENAVRSIELAIYNHDEMRRPFSAKGDSGSLIVNGKGEMVGLLHSGKSKTGMTSTWITYATPAWRLTEWIKEIYPNADFARETW